MIRFVALSPWFRKSVSVLRASRMFIVLSCLTLASVAVGQEGEMIGGTVERSQPGRAIPREEIDSGIVETLEPAQGTIIIEGYRYVLAPDVAVQMNGVAGTAADLAVGMQVQFRFLRVPGQLPQLLELRVIPPERRIYRR